MSTSAKLVSLNLRQWLGLVLLVVSTISWCAVPIIALQDIPTDQKISWAGVSYGLSLITWWTCLPLLGPELLSLGKKWWLQLKSLGRPPADPDR